MKRSSVYIASFVVIALSSCTASKPPVDMAPSLVREGPLLWSEVESIDMSDYPDQPVDLNRRIEHDVPEILMTSSADDGVIEEVEGYRIQIFSSLEQHETIEREEEARLWLHSLGDEQRKALGIEGGVDVYTYYRQPYYRVRIGDFQNREDAALLVARLSRVFPSALIVPDLIKIVR